MQPETEDIHWAILCPHYQKILQQVETRFYWFLNETEARTEFARASTANPEEPFYLIRKTGEMLIIEQINGPSWDYEGKAPARRHNALG